MRHKSNRGFTLLEIIIVIIIIGVLASLALPRFLNTVEASRGGEALQAISAVRGALSRCYLRASSYANCGDGTLFNNIDISNPGTAAGAHFSYFMTGSASAYSVRAVRNTRAGGTSTDYIQLIETLTNVSKSGTGSFKDVQ